MLSQNRISSSEGDIDATISNAVGSLIFHG
jgi:hypothetical protein